MISRSPMLTSLTETITGCPTIRAFGCGPLRVLQFQRLVDDSMANLWVLSLQIPALTAKILGPARPLSERP